MGRKSCIIGKVFVNSAGLPFTVIDKATPEQMIDKGIIPAPRKFYYVVEFVETGYRAVVRDTHIRDGKIKDKTAMLQREEQRTKLQQLKYKYREGLQDMLLPNIVIFYYNEADELKGVVKENAVDNAYTFNWTLQQMIKEKRYKFFVCYSGEWQDMSTATLRQTADNYFKLCDEIYSLKLAAKAHKGMKAGVNEIKKAKKSYEKDKAKTYKALDILEAAMNGVEPVKKVGRPRKERKEEFIA